MAHELHWSLKDGAITMCGAKGKNEEEVYNHYSRSNYKPLNKGNPKCLVILDLGLWVSVEPD